MLISLRYLFQDTRTNSCFDPSPNETIVLRFGSLMEDWFYLVVVELLRVISFSVTEALILSLVQVCTAFKKETFSNALYEHLYLEEGIRILWQTILRLVPILIVNRLTHLNCGIYSKLSCRWWHDFLTVWRTIMLELDNQMSCIERRAYRKRLITFEILSSPNFEQIGSDLIHK